MRHQIQWPKALQPRKTSHNKIPALPLAAHTECPLGLYTNGFLTNNLIQLTESEKLYFALRARQEISQSLHPKLTQHFSLGKISRPFSSTAQRRSEKVKKKLLATFDFNRTALFATRPNHVLRLVFEECDIDVTSDFTPNSQFSTHCIIFLSQSLSRISTVNGISKLLFGITRWDCLVC